MPQKREPPKLYFTDRPFEEAIDPRVLSAWKMKQYAQRTPGWYKIRGTCITASAAAATIPQSEESMGPYLDYYDLRDKFKIQPSKTCSKNETQLDFIMSKCGLGPKFIGNEFTRWGNKFENIVSNIYAQINQVDMLEFGLIPHPTIKFIGASPDGISSKGRMLEIKCPPCRKVANYPSLWYWIQMQLQLICTNLEGCDFFDAHFVEYLSRDDWETDAKQWKSENLEAKHHIYGIMLSYEPDEDDDDSGVEYEESDEEIVEDSTIEGEGEDTDSDSDLDIPAESTGDEPDKVLKHVYPTPDIVSVEDFKNWATEQENLIYSKKGKDTIRTYYKLHEYYITPAEVDYEWFNKILPHMESVWKQVVEGRTKKGMKLLKTILRDKAASKADKLIKRKEKKEKMDPDLLHFVDIDVSKALSEPVPIMKGRKSNYIHEVCLL